jgi:hypothetical protein
MQEYDDIVVAMPRRRPPDRIVTADDLDYGGGCLRGCGTLIVAVGVIALLIVGLSSRGSSGNSQGSPPDAVSPQGPSSTSVPASTAPDPGPSSDPHAGCQQAHDAIVTFDDTAGPTSTWSTWSVATTAVVTKLAGALQMAYNSGASSAVTTDLQALGTDFINLHSDSVAENHSSSDVSQTNADIERLNRDCGTG